MKSRGRARSAVTLRYHVLQARTVITGQVAARTTCCVLDPNNISSRPPVPWAHMTINSTLASAARRRIAL